MIDLREGHHGAATAHAAEAASSECPGEGDAFGLVPLIALATPTCMAVWSAIGWGVLRLAA